MREFLNNSLHLGTESLGGDGFDEMFVQTIVLRIEARVKHTANNNWNVAGRAVCTDELHQCIAESIWSMRFDNDRTNVVVCKCVYAFRRILCLDEYVWLAECAAVELPNTEIVLDYQQNAASR